MLALLIIGEIGENCGFKGKKGEINIKREKREIGEGVDFRFLQLW